MPDFTVTSPDGKTHKISGPPGSTPQDALAEVQRQLGTTSAVPSTSGAVEGKPYVAGPRSFGQTVGEGLSAVGQDLGDMARGIADFFKAPGDVVMGKYGGAGDPRLTEKARSEALGFAGAGAPAARPLIEAGARGLGTAAEIAAKPVTGPAALIGNATGRGAATASEGLRTGALGEAGKAIATKEGEAAPLDARAAAIARAQGQLADQPAVAAQRAAARAPVADPLRERVLAASRERVAKMEAEHRAAGATADQARDAVATSDARVAEAEQGVQQLEQQLLARPGTTPEQFGGAIRQTAQGIADKFGAIRSKQAGFGEALASAGEETRVGTQLIIDNIDAKLKDIRNPTLERVLTGTKELLQTDGKPGLSVKAADSLRKYLDGAISSKTFKDAAVDKEALNALGQIKKDLVSTATEAWPAYRDSLAKWRTLSRPLDIVERKGGLRKVLDTDPLSTDHALAEAEVVGRVIAQAKLGKPVFTKLLEQDPGIRDAARLHFTQQLFGKEVAPTVSQLRTFLKQNEAPLRQLGLYDEFRDIRVARQTAQAAVDEAKGAKVQTMAQARAADEAEKAARQKVAMAQSVRDLAKKRPDAVVLGQKLAEKGEAQAGTRAAAAGRRLDSEAGKVERSAAQEKGMADDFRKFRTEITRARPKEVPANTRAFVSQLRDKNMISDVEYDRYLKQIQDVEDKFKATAEARKRLIKIGATAAGLVGLAEGVNVTRGLTGR